ncbi:initiator tRNA phosphoribosyl transferase-domain-containing protein [Dendryphion nanum]|uniref:Initiator tRNA phosphoribosyl transferase-domain-containing protein n=1 Tax=Dendryphion nanum TaxID=256645 RepID=A0A9P9DPA3_9PLEO|nr:initiator tRNA phosphoribosyl transferase-domain-containing protein [Dendryphion nanum]
MSSSSPIFPPSNPTLSTTLTLLKRAALSITNRLNSITSDSQFVTAVSEAYGLPLVANERCGSWYIPLGRKSESVYFKSTDGHFGEWGFSTRRVNLWVLGCVGREEGCVIVDSTRRGKSMPDALSKTIPIWCCVLNRAIFPEKTEAHELFTSPQAVSASEHAQIEKRIDGFVRDFLSICKPDLPSLRTQLQKPLRPIWVTQNSTLPFSPPSFPSFHPVVLCTASRRVHGGEVSEAGYIQGAADDHEAWSHGLTPTLFWTHKDKLLSTNEHDLPALIAELVTQEKGPKAVPVLIKPTTSVFVSSVENLDIDPFDIVISCTTEPLTTTNPEHVQKKKYLHLPCAALKLGSRDLRVQLPRLIHFFAPALESIQTSHTQDIKILLCCPTGKDLSLGLALTILCLYVSDTGTLSYSSTPPRMNKTFIKQRLAWITSSSPGLNPSRETLKSVNSFLMPDPNTCSESPFSKGAKTKPTEIPPPEKPSHPIPPSPKSLFTTLSSHPWTFTRTLTSALPSHPSGTVTGTATFVSLDPEAAESSSSTAQTKYLIYTETGNFATTTGMEFTVSQKYIYALGAADEETGGEEEEDDKEPGQGKEKISIFFPSATVPTAPGGLFVEMDTLSLSPSPPSFPASAAPKHNPNDELVWTAPNKTHHLCAQDLYTASWKFGDTGEWWEVRYDVRGPRKEYVSLTRYVGEGNRGWDG